MTTTRQPRRAAHVLGLLATLFLPACGASSGPTPTEPGTDSKPGAPAWTGAQSADALGDVAAVVTGNTEFALDMYAKLAAADSGNLFFSPASISTALAMTYAGARNDTQDVMAKVMHFGLPQARLHASFKELDARLAAQPNKSELAIANRLWGEQSWTFLPEFLAVTRDQYGAELETLNFKQNPDAARKTINAWVEDATRGRIRDLLKKPNVRPDTRLILTNAVYFKAPWAFPFEKETTRPEPFWLASGEQQQTPMMRQIAVAGYGEVDGVKVLEMAYEGDALSMVVLLPAERDGLAALEKRLDTDTLNRLVTSTRRQKVDIWLPKFKYERRTELKKTFGDLGMGLAFSRRADFRGMTGQPELKIDDVIHQAFIAVYEEGTEAAAATAVVMAEITSAGPRPQPNVFRADHPFVYLIRDRATGTILFMGRLAQPEG